MKLKKSDELVNQLILEYPKTSVFCAGLLSKFCFSDSNGFVFFFIMIYIVLFSIQRLRTSRYIKQSFITGYIFGLGYFSASLFWVAESFKCVGLDIYAYPAVGGLILYLSFYPAIMMCLTKVFSKTRFKMFLLFSVFWTLTEYLRGNLFTGFSWNLAGYSTVSIPYFSQIADIVGAYGVSFFFILMISCLTYKKTIKYSLVIFFIIMSYGVWKVEFSKNYIEPKNQIITNIIQPSIEQEDKFDLRLLKENINKHIYLTNAQEDDKIDNPQLTIWPESAVGLSLNENNNVREYICNSLKNSKTILIIGSDRFEDVTKKLYNSLSITNFKGKILQFYDKRHLLPFGEFIPEFFNFFGLGKITEGMINYSSGTTSRIVNLPQIEQFETLVCYEIAFPGEVLDDTEKTKWIVNITNDSWFKKTDGPFQHLISVRFRAIEEGVSIARCANNGISCFIDCNGKVIYKLETDEVGKITNKMPMKYCKTIFSKFKHYTIFSILFVVLFIVLYNNNFKNNFKMNLMNFLNYRSKRKIKKSVKSIRRKKGRGDF